MLKAAALKKYVKDGRTDAPLYQASIAGVRWATNSYWLVRAEVLAPLFKEYNLDPAADLACVVNGRVEVADRTIPNLAALLAQPDLVDLVELAEGGPTHRLDPNGRPLRALRTQAADYVYVREDYFTFVEAAANTLPTYSEHVERYEYRQTAGKPGAAIVVDAVIRSTPRPSDYVDPAKVPAPTERVERVALVMPVRMS